MENNFVVDCRGLSGGLALLWREDIDVSLESYTQYHIFISVKKLTDGKTQILTGFYGNPSTAKKQASWYLLRGLKPSSDLVLGILIRQSSIERSMESYEILQADGDFHKGNGGVLTK